MPFVVSLFMIDSDLFRSVFKIFFLLFGRAICQ